MSRIGKLPVPVPDGVDVKIDGLTVTVKGPKGTLHLLHACVVAYASAVSSPSLSATVPQIKADSAVATVSAVYPKARAPRPHRFIPSRQAKRRTWKGAPL